MDPQRQRQRYTRDLRQRLLLRQRKRHRHADPDQRRSWVSTGTQTEEESASAGANHTTYFSLLPAGSSGAASGVYTWQATSGSGSTWGGQSTFGQYSGGGQYTAYSGGYAGGGSIQGTFSQAQSNTQSWNFNTKDAYQPATSTSPGYWQASSTGSSGTTVDSGGSSFYYSGGGVYGGSQAAPTGTLSQSGSGSETFSYTKNYGVDSSGNWHAASGSGGGASGSGWTYSSYYGTIPLRHLAGRRGRRHRLQFGPERDRPAERQQQHLVQFSDGGVL